MNILVTGGAGYIGSHTCVSLLDEGHNIVVVDNFSNSSPVIMDKVKEITGKEFVLYNIDVTSESELEQVFNAHSFDGVIHFAGFKAVGESVKKPLEYYFNNMVGTLILSKLCIKYDVSKLVFSSSATVYGDNKSPFVESMNLLPTTNPYGETKAMSERMLMDIVNAYPHFSVSILRYFNPVGAHESGLIGERPSGVPNNIMPYIAQVAKRKRDMLHVYGNDYPTVDGTGVRDYIHVMDLADGHVAALKYQAAGISTYNLGTGHGTSVLELIHTFEKANNVTIPYKIVDRRSGDIASCYADTSKAKIELGWVAKRDLFTMCRDAWRFEYSHSSDYAPIK